VKESFSKLTLFFLFTLVFVYWPMWFKLGPSVARYLVQKISGKKRKIKKFFDPEAEKFLTKLGYSFSKLMIVDSPKAFGMALPTGKVVISSKIYQSENLNLIKYIIIHEIAHMGQRLRWTIFYPLSLLLFLLVANNFSLTIYSIALLAFFQSQIILQISRGFEDEADRVAAEVLGKEKVAKAVLDLFKINKNSLEKRHWLKKLIFLNRDFPDRMKAIGVLKDAGNH